MVFLGWPCPTLVDVTSRRRRDKWLDRKLSPDGGIFVADDNTFRKVSERNKRFRYINGIECIGNFWARPLHRLQTRGDRAHRYIDAIERIKLYRYIDAFAIPRFRFPSASLLWRSTRRRPSTFVPNQVNDAKPREQQVHRTTFTGR